MSEIALYANFVALSRGKEEQFLSTTKSKILCAIELCSICMFKPKKTRDFLGAENPTGFSCEPLVLRVVSNTPPASGGGS